MKCSNCGKRISKKFKLCPNCGTKVGYIKKEINFKLNKKVLIIIGCILIVLITVTSIIIFNNKVDFEKLKLSVVMINVYDKDNELFSTGSGVVAFENDIILTNAHVVDNNYKIEVISENNTKYRVDGILDYNKKEDIAILKLSSSKGLKKVKIGKKEKIGNDVTSIGSPLGLKNTISTGIISAKFQDNIEVYQHTAPISPGSSGGALFNSKGKLIGITYASITEGQNLNLAIPIEYYEKEYNKVKNNESIDTQYYSWVSNSIIKTNSGINLLNYVLNDSFENYKSKSGAYDEYEHKKGNLNRCLSLSNCKYVFDEDYKKISKNVKSSLYLNSGYSSMCIYNSLTPGSVCHPLYEGSNYTVSIIQLNSKKDEVLNNTKKFYEQQPFAENGNIYVKNNYVYFIGCENYDDCDTIKKLVEDIVNQ